MNTTTGTPVVIGIFIGMLIGAFVTLALMLDDKQQAPKQKLSEVTQEQPVPTWSQGFKMECIGQVCKDMETGCQYLWPIDNVNRKDLTPRLNAQGKPMCGTQ